MCIVELRIMSFITCFSFVSGEKCVYRVSLMGSEWRLLFSFVVSSSFPPTPHPSSPKGQAARCTQWKTEENAGKNSSADWQSLCMLSSLCFDHILLNALNMAKDCSVQVQHRYIIFLDVLVWYWLLLWDNYHIAHTLLTYLLDLTEILLVLPLTL